MRKIILGAVLSAICLSPLGAQAAPQSVEGSIASPTRFIDGNSGFPGLGRRLYTLSPATQGLVSYTIAVDPATRGLDFVIDNVADLTGAADLDVFFYSEFGSDVDGTAPLVSEGGEFVTRAAGGESGTVPEDANYAIVFTYNGVGNTFTYTAG